MYILGISCFYHDSAACLIKDGEIVAAAQEERFTRKKHDPAFPEKAVKFCLNQAGITASDLDYVGFYDKPFVKFERILLTYIATFPKSFSSFSKSMPVWLKDKLWTKRIIQEKVGFEKEILFINHHQSHAASAFLVSPFDEAAILTIDGVGEWATATYGVGKGTKTEIIKEINFPHSLGLLYSAFTYYLGFKVNSAEYKVMGLAPYGKPVYYDLIMKELIDVKDDGSFKCNMKYFAYDYGLTMTNGKFDELFGEPPREPETKIGQRQMDLAASVQKVTEEIVLRMSRYIQAETGLNNLCMAGGVALNCVSNGRVLREGPFDNIFIQPAAGDAGGSVGVAKFIYHSILGKPRGEAIKNSFFGPEFSSDEIRNYLDKINVKYKELSRDEVIKKTATLIHEQNVIGWFQGRMEFGPRALGNRSIIADATNPKNKDVVNLKIKFRESFRPFAPSVLAEKAGEYFELDCPSPYMLLVANVRENKRIIPAVTHVDHSARIQTVTCEENEIYYDLISEFEKLSGVPVIINTSFNVRGEPVVCTPHDAYMCFMRTNMDYLVMGNFILDKKEMEPLKEDVDWRTLFALD